MIATDEQDRADTAAFYARLGLSPDGTPLDLSLDHEPDDPAMDMQVPDSLQDQPDRSMTLDAPPRPFRVEAAQPSTTDQLVAVLGTFAVGECVPQSEVVDTLHALGLTFSHDTLHKARKRAGITTRRVFEGRKGYWVWTRPAVSE